MTNDLNQDQRMHRICNTLLDQGYKVTLVGRKKNVSDPLYEQSFEQHRLSLFFESGVLFYLEYQIRLLVFLLTASSAKLMVSVDLDTAFPVRVASWIKRCKSIHDAHELFTDVPELMKSPIKRWLWTRVGKMTMKGFDHRFTVNKSLSRILEKKYNCEFTVLRNLPISKEKSTAKLQFDRPYIWYQGVLNEGRGLEQMIAAMKDLPSFDLRIAGEGDRSLTLRLQAEKSSASDRIIFHGWMNAKEMHDWASNAWLGINLLDENSGNYYHSLANRTFDYIQAGLPALHMDFPEYREVVEQYNVGVLLGDLNATAIRKMINLLHNDHDKYTLLRQFCDTYKSELTWDNESEKFTRFINKMV